MGRVSTGWLKKDGSKVPGCRFGDTLNSFQRANSNLEHATRNLQPGPKTVRGRPDEQAYLHENRKSEKMCYEWFFR